jgi:transmembrane sensor
MSYNHNILLDKYFRGTATAEELDALEKWIAQSTENQRLFDNSTLLFEQLNFTEETIPSFNVSNAETSFKNYIQTETKEIKIHSRNKYFWTSIAASITVLIFISFFGLKYYQGFGDEELAYATSSNTLHKTLPDSTIITLSKNSNLKYCKKESGQKQIIKLQGEARIDIAPKESGNILIDAGDVFIQDIGTVFTVTAYPNDKFVKVTVNEGKVNFYSKYNNGILLAKNETGIYNKSTKQFEKIIQQQELQPGKTDTLDTQTSLIEYKNKNLSEVIHDINEKYKTNIYINDYSLGNQKITATFNGESLDVVLEVISVAMNIKVAKTKKGYLLEKRELE